MLAIRFKVLKSSWVSSTYHINTTPGTDNYSMMYFNFGRRHKLPSFYCFFLHSILISLIKKNHRNIINIDMSLNHSGFPFSAGDRRYRRLWTNVSPATWKDGLYIALNICEENNGHATVSSPCPTKPIHSVARDAQKFAGEHVAT